MTIVGFVLALAAMIAQPLLSLKFMTLAAIRYEDFKVHIKESVSGPICGSADSEVHGSPQGNDPEVPTSIPVGVQDSQRGRVSDVRDHGRMRHYDDFLPLFQGKLVR